MEQEDAIDVAHTEIQRNGLNQKCPLCIEIFALVWLPCINYFAFWGQNSMRFSFIRCAILRVKERWIWRLTKLTGSSQNKINRGRDKGKSRQRARKWRETMGKAGIELDWRGNQ